MRTSHSLISSFIPIAALLVAGYAMAQTAVPDTSRNATPAATPDSSRISQRCTTTGLSSDAAARCPDDVLSDGPRPVPPVVASPSGVPGSSGTATTPPGIPGTEQSGTASPAMPLAGPGSATAPGPGASTRMQ